MNIVSGAMILMLAGLSVSTSIAADWSSGMQGGGVVTVDSASSRASITRDGVTSPLWDGVHLLQDGSAMIINNGVVVTGASADTPHQLPPPEAAEWEGMPVVGYSPCEQLTRRVCGLQNECATAGACNPSQQLLTMEQAERSKAEDGSRMTFTSGQCLKAMHDEAYFLPCRHTKEQQ
jgi:hypothetical protein